MILKSITISFGFISFIAFNELRTNKANIGSTTGNPKIAINEPEAPAFAEIALIKVSDAPNSIQPTHMLR